MIKIIIALVAIAAVMFYVVKVASGNNKLAEENIQRGQDFLKMNANSDGVKTTESGLQYLVLQEGTGTVHPNANDRVKVHYHGTLIDGTVFDSSVERGEPISFGLNQVIPGWTEGVQLMVEGEKTRLFIPSNLAYGNRNMGLQPGSLLIFEVELLGINQ